METAKPQCGGGGSDPNNYDFPLHIVATFLVFLFSIGGAGFPVVAKRISWMKIPPKIFFFCKHFGTGVLVATAFVHLIPTAFQSLTDPCLPDLFTVKYPAMPGVIMMASLFSLFVIEIYLKSKTGGHSHGGPTGEDIARDGAPPRPSRSGVPSPPDYNGRSDTMDNSVNWPIEKDPAPLNVDETNTGYSYKDIRNYGLPSEMPPWFQVFFAQYIRQREDLRLAVERIAPRASAVVTYKTPDEENGAISAETEIDEATFKKMSLNITLLEGGILFHSVFVGMTVSITTEGFLILLIAILFHQFFEGLGLGSRIAAVPYPKGTARPWILVVAFGTTAPIGMAIGLITRNTYDPQSTFALILVGVFNAISSGLLLYAATVDLLAEDFLSDEAQALMSKGMKIKAFIFVLMGAIGMAVVGAFA